MRSELRSPLLRWYRRNRRELPWRGTDDPYRVWVAEIMLQQTRVATVIPYYRRFLDRLPDVQSLARASEDEVLSLWSGLGYYRRARSLHAGAVEVVRHHDGRLPDTARALARLPGIGRYTAGAIASVAFGRREPILDGNVRRVLARLFAVDGDGGGPAAERRELWKIAAALVQGPDPGDLNQALMELGALVCTPRQPECASCPLSRHCRAYRRGTVDAYPVSEPRQPTRSVDVAVALVRRGNRFLLERTGRESPLRGTWDVPACELDDEARGRDVVRKELARRHGVELVVGERQLRLSHAIMQRRLRLGIYPCSLRRGRVAESPLLRWVTPAGLAGIPVSGATRKVLRLAGEAGSSSMGPVQL